jgi:hypothetical protein
MLVALTPFDLYGKIPYAGRVEFETGRAFLRLFLILSPTFLLVVTRYERVVRLVGI